MPRFRDYCAQAMLVVGLTVGAAQVATAERGTIAGKIDVAVSAAGNVAVQITAVPLDVVLAEVGDKLGFVVERPEGATMPMLSGRFEGDLDRVINKLLRQHSHLIVRGGPKSHGIARVLLLGGGGTMVAVTAPGAQPATTAAVTPSAETAAVAAGTPVDASTPTPPTDMAAAENFNRQIQTLSVQLSGVRPVAELPADPTNVEAMTRSLTANASASVAALVASLKAVCADASCTQSGKIR